jgi:transcription antitermination factor NusG
MLNWYVLQTRSNHEPRVAEELVRKGIESYLPMFRELRQWKDRKKLIEVPVFRSYVFARFEDGVLSRIALLRSSGVVRILGSGRFIAPVPDQEIESLQLMLTRATTRCFAHPLLREGAWVRVKRGPLKDLEGSLVRVRNQTRLVISITMLSQSVSAEVDASDVQFLRLASERQVA